MQRRPFNFKVGEKFWLSTKNLSVEYTDGSGKRKGKYCGQFQITDDVNGVMNREKLSQPIIDEDIYNIFEASAQNFFLKMISSEKLFLSQTSTFNMEM